MRKEIIVNADELESRVALHDDGQFADHQVERDPPQVGSIYKARVVSVLPGMDAAFADVGLEKNVFLCADDVGFVSRDGVTAASAPRSRSISERLKEGQEVVVQIVRAPVGGKGARATTRLALPGRYLVLLLYDGKQTGVSRKIEDRKERERLRKIGDRIRPRGMGLIVRTEAEGRGARDLEADLKVLRDLRTRLTREAAGVKAPALLHQDLTLTYQVIRDVFTDDVKSLIIDAKSVYDNAVELVKTIAPTLRRRIKRYRARLPVFYKHGIEGEIDRLLRRRVWLPAGGYISIDQAEAFTAIDVNTGRYTGSTGLADTILRTNLEAAEEIARQLRLRDLGGIIVIDFIDMERRRDREKVLKSFEEALKRDRQKTKIVHLSPLGLVEMTRKRRGESLIGILTQACPQCAGLARVRNTVTIALKVEREVRRVAAEGKAQTVLVRATPSVAAVLIGEEGRRAKDLEKSAGRPVYIRADGRLGIEEQEVAPITLAALTRAVKAHAPGDELVVDRLEPRQPSSGDEVFGWCDGYRVQIKGPRPTEEPATVVLTEAGHSFARGHVKGAQPAEEAPRRRGRRRSARGRGRPGGSGKAQSATPSKPPTPAEEKGAAAPAGRAPGAKEPTREEKAPSPPSSAGRGGARRTGRRRPRGSSRRGRSPKETETPQPAAAAAPAPAPARKTGLLRRGARQIVRVRR